MLRSIRTKRFYGNSNDGNFTNRRIRENEDYQRIGLGIFENKSNSILTLSECTFSKWLFFVLEFQKPEDVDAKDLKTTKEQKKYVTTQTPFTMPGHTGYLTFATIPPLFAR